MRTTRHPIRQLLSLVGTGLMLAGLFGGPALPVVSAADVEPFASQNNWGSQHPWGPHDYRGTRDPWGPQDSWGYRHDRPRRRELGYELPDRYTIHKGKKCELRCERVRGTRDYSCREHRC
jgi:hypothetical protein